MNQIYENLLVKQVLDILIFLEFSNEEAIDPDVSIELMEQIHSDLSLLKDRDLNKFAISVKEVADNYDIKHKNFIMNWVSQLVTDYNF